MFLKNYHIMFIMMLITGTLISISANTWFTAWLGLEINLMSMIPLILIKLSPLLSEASIKYFLSQAIASIILMMFSCFNMFFQENISLELNEMFLMISLCLKGGIPPLHYWFPQVSININWFQCIILFTWQKIAPMILLTSLTIKTILVISILSALTGALGGFNQTIMKMILTYSSISHAGWMLLAMSFKFSIWMIYFLIYSILSMAIILFFYSNQTKKISQIFINQDSPMNKIILVINMLSLGGIPPLLGFSAKLSIMIISIKSSNYILMLPLIISSLISLFFYSRVIYTNLMSLNKKMKLNKNTNKSYNYLYTSSCALNILAPFIFMT